MASSIWPPVGGRSDVSSVFKACAPELWLCPHKHHLGVRLRGELCFMSQLSSPSLCCLPLGQSQAHAPEECAWDLGRFIHDISWSAPSSSVFSELALTLACRDHYSRCLWPEGQGLSCEFLLLLSQRGVCSVFPGGASGKDLPANVGDREMKVRSPSQEDPLEEGMATRSSILVLVNSAKFNDISS